MVAKPDMKISRRIVTPGGLVMIFRAPLIGLIRCYQLCISPMIPPSCRFTPSCSQYAIDAIVLHGPFYGSYLAARRVLRCHPFARGGYDPVMPISTHKVEHGN